MAGPRPEPPPHPPTGPCCPGSWTRQSWGLGMPSHASLPGSALLEKGTRPAGQLLPPSLLRMSVFPLPPSLGVPAHQSVAF